MTLREDITLLITQLLNFRKEIYMATLPSYFNDYLANIRLTADQNEELKKAHETLRSLLKADEDLSGSIVATFLQGSYRRSTAVKPHDGSHADVDIIVVTSFNKDLITPSEALSKFVPFMEEHYKGKYRIQGRSIGIELKTVDLDVVPTAAPSEATKDMFARKDISSFMTIEDFESELTHRSSIGSKAPLLENSVFSSLFSKTDEQWKNEPLWIPDREAQKWDRTHPLEQIRWTVNKNRSCNTFYVNVVKAIKWWYKEKYPEIKQPKSYPLEHFIGDCCPDEILSVAQGIVETFEVIVKDYPYKPFLQDRGVPEHDVFARITDEEYHTFYQAVQEYVGLARAAYDEEDVNKSAKAWHDLFGDEFPYSPESSNNGGPQNNGFTPRHEQSKGVPTGRFAK